VVLLFFVMFTFLMVTVKLTGFLTLDKIESWLNLAKSVSPWLVGSIVVALLYVELFIAVPTLSVTILSGYFLGWPLGALAPLLGMFLATFTGYGLSRCYGDAILRFLVRKPDERTQMVEAFERIGFAMIVFGRAVPMLPEASACLAGATKMPLSRYALGWFLGTLPYSLLASYSGSVSTLDNPTPAILVAISIPAGLSILWFLLNRNRKKQAH
jgi:uncharacterized membrane protein YdjX (TVP38/TMEM64 family)